MVDQLTTFQEFLLDTGVALDVEVIGSPTDDTNVWELHGFLDGKEYFWGSSGAYVESVGFREADGRYFAAVDERYRDGVEGYTCVWYRYSDISER